MNVIDKLPALVQRVVEAIPVGKENAVTREKLSETLMMPDRQVRKCIQIARDAGVLIVNTGRGYYITDELDEIERQYWQDTRRALSVLARRREMRRILRDAGRRV